MTDKAVEMVAELMKLSGRTAPKGRGLDTIIIRLVVGKDLQKLATKMRNIGEIRKLKFFSRDANNIEQSDACLLIASQKEEVTGLNCGGCGFDTCDEMLEKQKTSRLDNPFQGPNCIIKMTDLGIALGSAVKTASQLNVDNRVMYTAGVSALSLGWLEGCGIAYGIPLKASGKNIFFDRFDH
ncbi:MAG: DUF2148 domain-containing protein [Methanotrichaceae archaeon]|nr:DUF2148 domain-containing protein [Methanotrichaceae archaeon]